MNIKEKSMLVFFAAILIAANASAALFFVICFFYGAYNYFDVLHFAAAGILTFGNGCGVALSTIAIVQSSLLLRVSSLRVRFVQEQPSAIEKQAKCFSFLLTASIILLVAAVANIVAAIFVVAEEVSAPLRIFFTVLEMAIFAIPTIVSVVLSVLANNTVAQHKEILAEYYNEYYNQEQLNK